MTERTASDSTHPGDDGPELPSDVAAKSGTLLNLLSEFAARAAELGVVVERVATSDAVVPLVERLADELGVARISTSAELLATAPNLRRQLERSEVAAVVPRGPDELRHEPLGMSLGQAAIAETGSILLAEASLADRAIGMLAAVQIIICRTADLVPSLDQTAPLLRALALRPGGAYTTLVTGPSRTADIERVLTVGVQGPGRLMIVFVDDLT